MSVRYGNEHVRYLARAGACGGRADLCESGRRPAGINGAANSIRRRGWEAEGSSSAGGGGRHELTPQADAKAPTSRLFCRAAAAAAAAAACLFGDAQILPRRGSLCRVPPVLVGDGRN